MFNIDDTPNIFKHSFDCSVFKFNITNDNDDNIIIPSNNHITIWNNTFVDFFIILVIHLQDLNTLYFHL